MRKKTISIIDYGVGNHASVMHVFNSLGYRCRVSKFPGDLSASDVLVLPGVGAFPPAMANLRRDGTDNCLRELALKGKPIIGMCLGMQLLAEESLENGHTFGLGLIPGVVRPLKDDSWHIGWNVLQINHQEALFTVGDEDAVYFNHSYYFDTSDTFSCAKVKIRDQLISAAVRHGNICGLQFHPEKCQAVGQTILSQLLGCLGNA